MRCYYYWKNNQYRNTRFASIKFALFKSCHLHVSSRILQWFGKLSQWNRHIDGRTFQSGLRFQTGWSSLRLSCKRPLTLYLLKIIANTNKYLQSDWVRRVKYWLYLYAVFNIYTLLLIYKKSTFDFRSGKIEMCSLKTGTAAVDPRHLKVEVAN